MTATTDIGPIGRMPAEQVVGAAALVREGRMISLAATRFPGMPLFPGHPPFQVLNYRTPRGIRVTGAQPWGPVNDAGLGYMAEYVMATSHSGAHMDALAHMTVGDDMHWYGGSPGRRAPDRLRPHPSRRVDACRRSSPAACCSTPPATAASDTCRRARRSMPPRWTRCVPPRASRSGPGTWW